MERALRYELQQIFPGIRIFPTNAPKDATPPFIIYLRDSTVWDKTLDGFINGEEITYTVNIMGETYEQMVQMREAVENLLREMIKSSIGENEDILVKDLDLNGVAEVFEQQLGLYRGIVDFTVYI
ncbi:MAG: DUF3168 domain-containing protein [Defluviitaleaceae bacterium]|nr:DUF3168 domain-containing protein [Defluviitaleaceae bacterium]MCL2263778.1 DUF3168 domain-containing protein [Defluviitaleaceae bacterium]